MHLRLITDSNVAVGVNFIVNDYQSVCVNTAMDWWTVQGVLHLLLYDNWDNLKPSCNPKLDRRLRGWIYG